MTTQGVRHHQIATPAILEQSETANVRADVAEHAEAELLRAARHDLDSFASIYDRYATRVYLYCLRRVTCPQEAEDLTSLTFTHALSALDQYRGGSVAAWLFAITRNVIADHFRNHQTKRVALEQVEEILPDTKPSPVEQVIHNERCAHLRELIATFTEDEQELIALSISGELTSKEIGAVTGKRPGAIRMRLHRLMKRLRALCAEEYA